MKKTIVSINALLAWTLFLIPSTAQTPMEPIPEQDSTLQSTTTSINGDKPSSLGLKCPSPNRNLANSGGPELATTPQKPPLAVWQDLRSHHLNRQPSPSSSQHADQSGLRPPKKHLEPTVPPSQANIIEAQGWTRDPEGRILLTAKVSVQTPAPLNTEC